MAYNVFKRPMFKRGGSTTGTGIMSHVEPRIKAQRGYGSYSAGFPYEMSQFSIMPQSNIRPTNLNDYTNIPVKKNITYPMTMDSIGGYGFIEPGPETDLETLPDWMLKAIGTEESRGILSKRKTGIQTVIPEKTLSGGATSLDQIVKENITKQRAEKNKLLETSKNTDIEKDKPAYKGTDIKAEVESETKLIKELLKDEGYSKGELALLIAGAVGEPGTISDKLAKARELALPIAKKRKEEDRAITLAAYKLAKEKEREQIKADAKASTGTEYQRNLRDVARATANQPGEERSADEIYDSLLAAKTPGAEVRMKQLEKISPNILEAAKDIANLKVELKKAKTDKDKQRIQGDIDRKLSLLEQVSDFPEFEIAFPGLKERVGLKEGGRVKLAEGTEVEDDIITSNVSFGSGSATTSEPVQQLSYEQLRDRLPPEITDDVVNLLANNAEALQQFAYIRTQEDVNAFNVKYGVNLVIPPTRT